MKTLDSLVPPLEICQYITGKHFANSALVWATAECLDDPHVMQRETVSDLHEWMITAPAPTLEEILEELPKYNENEVTLACVPAFISEGEKREFGGAWSVGYTHKNNVTAKSAATAAMKLWIILVGWKEPK